MYGRIYHSADTPARHCHPLATCSSDTLCTEDTASRLGTEGKGPEGGPGSCHGNSYHSNNTSTEPRHHRHSNTTHTVRTLSVCVFYTMCVSDSSLDEFQQQLHKGSGSSAHSLSPGNVVTLRADGRTHTPVYFLSRWLCRRRAVIGPLHDTHLLTRQHTGGEHSTDLWGQTVIGR